MLYLKRRLHIYVQLKQKADHPLGGLPSKLAAGEGFEPSHTESESAVLPLHNPAMSLTNDTHYTHLAGFVKRILKKI